MSVELGNGKLGAHCLRARVPRVLKVLRSDAQHIGSVAKTNHCPLSLATAKLAPIVCVPESLGYCRCCEVMPEPSVVSHTPSPW